MSENTAATAVAKASGAQVSTPEKGKAQIKASRSRFGGRGLNVAIGIAALVAAAGIVLWIMQLSGGLVQTGMRNLDSWGLYITMFMFLVGLSAGGLIISSVPRAFNIKGFGGIAKIAVWTSICCTILAIAFVVVDLGHPARLWELFAYSNMVSPLMWDIVVLGVYLVLSVIYLWATLRYESGKGTKRALRALSVIALVCAVLVHSVTAWIFGLQQGRELWHTALLAPWFVSSALVCGTALVLVVAVALKSVGYLTLDRGHIVKMAKLLGAFVCVDLYFFGCDLLTSAFPGAQGEDIVLMLTSGPLAPFFWIEVALAVFAALVAFVPRLRTTPLMVAASAAAILSIFCKRVELLVGGFQIPNIDFAGPLTPSALPDWTAGSGAYDALIYWPTPLEFGIVAGVVGLGALLFLVGLKYLPLGPVEHKD